MNGQHKQVEFSFARNLIEMDVTRPLPKMIKLRDPKGSELEQQIWHERKLIFCQKCLQVDHSREYKPKLIPPNHEVGAQTHNANTQEQETGKL